MINKLILRMCVGGFFWADWSSEVWQVRSTAKHSARRARSQSEQRTSKGLNIAQILSGYPKFSAPHPHWNYRPTSDPKTFEMCKNVFEVHRQGRNIPGEMSYTPSVEARLQNTATAMPV